MTFSIGHVQGGTGAGWRRTRAKYEPWTCHCLGPEHASGNAHTPIARDVKLNPGYLKKCIDCRTERP